MTEIIKTSIKTIEDHTPNYMDINPGAYELHIENWAMGIYKWKHKETGEEDQRYKGERKFKKISFIDGTSRIIEKKTYIII